MSKSASKPKKKNPNMRTANIRISQINYIHTDNIELGLKEGDIVKYSFEDIIAILDDWFGSKQFNYYIIEHNEDPTNVHYHIIIEFSSNSQCKFSTLKKKFPYGFIDTCRQVSQLYIAQVKRKHGIIERINYNIGEGKSKAPQVTPEKETAIEDALRHFKMIE